MSALDLDAAASARAARREGSNTGLTVTFHGQTFDLPAELPFAVLDRLLDPDLELGALMATAVHAFKAGEAAALDAVGNMLRIRPDLPAGIAKLVFGAIEDVFGTEQWTRFRGLGPSLDDFLALARGLLGSYGTSLGKALASSSSSGSGGTTSKPISNASTGLTPETSGEAEKIPNSSEPAD